MARRILGLVAFLIMGAGLAEAQPGAGYYPPQPWNPPPMPQWGPLPPWVAPPTYMAPYPRYCYPMPPPPPVFTPVYQPRYPYPTTPSCQQCSQLPTEGTAPIPPGQSDGSSTTGESSCVSEPEHGPVVSDIISVNRGPCLRYWITPEYLYWTAKPGPLAMPIVTTGSNSDTYPGAIGQPGTHILFGGNGVSYPGSSGIRGTLGMWVDSDNKWGVEGSVFVLQSASRFFSASSNSAGNPLLAIPVVNQTPGALNEGGEGSFLITTPSTPASGTVITPGLPLAGSVFVSNRSQLYGAELNGIYNLFRNRGFEASFLGGLRYVNLQESFNLTANDHFTDNLGDTTSFTVNDSFDASNQFFGGQVGLRAEFHYGSFFATATGKAALGANFESTNINGSTLMTSNSSGASVTTASTGGFFAQATNIGRQHETPFSAVPQLSLKFGWEPTPYLRLFAGYDFLYWFNVVRPGNQIDRNVNQTQSVTLSTVSSLPPDLPARMFNTSNYYVQGITAGFEFRY